MPLYPAIQIGKRKRGKVELQFFTNSSLHVNGQLGGKKSGEHFSGKEGGGEKIWVPPLPSKLL